MKTGDSVIYRINETFERPAKVLKENPDGSDDLMVFVHPDDYPEFTRQECVTGNGVRRNVKEGLKPGDYYYKGSEPKA